jgi:phage-related protein
MRGHIQGKLDLGAEEMEFITESEGMALSEVLNTLRSLSSNVSTLTQSVSTLASEFNLFKWVVPIIVTIGMAVVAIIVAIK